MDIRLSGVTVWRHWLRQTEEPYGQAEQKQKVTVDALHTQARRFPVTVASSRSQIKLMVELDTVSAIVNAPDGRARIRHTIV
jgi:hypothetical protein